MVFNTFFRFQEIKNLEKSFEKKLEKNSEKNFSEEIKNIFSEKDFQKIFLEIQKFLPEEKKFF
jgi:hypothetical protein